MPIRPFTNSGGDTDCSAMRRLVLILLVLVLAAPGGALARTRASRRRHARRRQRAGSWSRVRARGGIIGRFDSGSDHHRRPDRGRRQRTGRLRRRAASANSGGRRTRYSGEDVRFRLIGGRVPRHRPGGRDRRQRRRPRHRRCSTPAASPTSPAASRSTAGRPADAGRRADHATPGSASAARPRQVGKVSARSSARGTNQTVLVVEDESSIASFVALYLKNAGYAVRTAATGSEALAQFQASQPALDRPRPDAAGHRRHRGLPPDPQELRRADPDADRARRGRRQDHRPRGRRRRLPDEAVQPARARRAREVDPPPRRAGAPRRSRASRSATAT